MKGKNKKQKIFTRINIKIFKFINKKIYKYKFSMKKLYEHTKNCNEMTKPTCKYCKAVSWNFQNYESLSKIWSNYYYYVSIIMNVNSLVHEIMSLPCKKLQRKEMSISLLLENKEKSKSPRLKTKKSRQNVFKENLERWFDLGKRRYWIQVWL